jgi:hypothetical protein
VGTAKSIDAHVSVNMICVAAAAALADTAPITTG